MEQPLPQINPKSDAQIFCILLRVAEEREIALRRQVAEQEAEIERLRSALLGIARCPADIIHLALVAVGMREIAREALREQPPNATDHPR